MLANVFEGINSQKQAREQGTAKATPRIRPASEKMANNTSDTVCAHWGLLSGHKVEIRRKVWTFGMRRATFLTSGLTRSSATFQLSTSSGVVRARARAGAHSRARYACVTYLGYLYYAVRSYVCLPHSSSTIRHPFRLPLPFLFALSIEGKEGGGGAA